MDGTQFKSVHVKHAKSCAKIICKTCIDGYVKGGIIFTSIKEDLKCLAEPLSRVDDAHAVGVVHKLKENLDRNEPNNGPFLPSKVNVSKP